jgi:DNA-binding LacI/PurR family transcriptional regulator
MARLLLDLISGEAQPHSSVILDTHLVGRASA